MKIYDISQEVFGCAVFPGDPAPKREILNSIKDGSLYNLTAFSMCAHNGTHLDAPYHFINEGKTVDKIPLFKTVGLAFVAEHDGVLTSTDAENILERAEKAEPESAKRILNKGREFQWDFLIELRKLAFSTARWVPYLLLSPETLIIKGHSFF